MKLPLSRVAEFIAAAGQFDPSVTAHGYSIDSRTVQPGELFFAVKGDRFDGHDFVESALARGAVGAVVRKDQLVRYSTHSGVGTGASPVQPGEARPPHSAAPRKRSLICSRSGTACIAPREISTITSVFHSDC
jgi:hypothetical protein